MFMPIHNACERERGACILIISAGTKTTPPHTVNRSRNIRAIIKYLLKSSWNFNKCSINSQGMVFQTKQFRRVILSYSIILTIFRSFQYHTSLLISNTTECWTSNSCENIPHKFYFCPNMTKYACVIFVFVSQTHVSAFKNCRKCEEKSSERISDNGGAT